MLLPKRLRKGVLWASLPASGSSLTCGCTPVVFTWLSVCAKSPLFIRHQSYWVRAHPNDLISTWSPTKILFPKSVTFTGTANWTLASLWGMQFSLWGFPGGSVLKNPPVSAGAAFSPWVGKIPWRKKRKHSSVPACRIPWMEEPGGLQAMGWQKSPTWLSD